jgi:DNA polymerase elongation subunit (family B)
LKVLLLDIESAPNRVYSWGLWDQNIATSQVEETGYVLCWAAQWLGEREIMFDGVKASGRKPMLTGMHKLLDQADIAIHYNGMKYDIPTLNKEFIKTGMMPPSPYKQVDLYQVVRRAFRFESNKLSFVSEALEIGQKVKHEGFKLWVDCMDAERPGHEKAWRKMERYNRGDVRLLAKLYRRLRPWIARHPNMAEGLGCPKCGSKQTQQRGTQVAQTRTYNRYHCQACGGWFRSSCPKDIGKPKVHGVNIV